MFLKNIRPGKPSPQAILKAWRDREGVRAPSFQNNESNKFDRYEDVNKAEKI
jgi:hypothetical protein